MTDFILKMLLLVILYIASENIFTVALSVGISVLILITATGIIIMILIRICYHQSHTKKKPP